MKRILNPAGIVALLLFTACTVAQTPPMPGPPPVVVPVDPQPAPEPKPDPVVPDVKTGIIVPAQSPDHSLIRLACTFTAERAGDDRTWRFWEVGADGWQRLTDRVKVEPLDGCRSQLIATAEPGNYLAECFGDGAPYTAAFKVGDPPPPVPEKPLSELAGKDAGALAAFYRAQALPEYLARVATGAAFWEAHEAGLAIRHLEANGARAAIEARLEVAVPKDGSPIDAAKLTACLEKIVADLGAPTPTPGPGPAPITDAGLRVLITYDSGSKGRLPREQLALIDSPTLRAWLDAHCTKNGSVPEWRIVDNTAEFNDDQPAMKKLMAQPRAGSPWLIVTNGKGGESVPLPANEAAVLALIGKYAQ